MEKAVESSVKAYYMCHINLFLRHFQPIRWMMRWTLSIVCSKPQKFALSFKLLKLILYPIVCLADTMA